MCVKKFRHWRFVFNIAASSPHGMKPDIKILILRFLGTC